MCRGAGAGTVVVVGEVVGVGATVVVVADGVVVVVVDDGVVVVVVDVVDVVVVVVSGSAASTADAAAVVASIVAARTSVIRRRRLGRSVGTWSAGGIVGRSVCPSCIGIHGADLSPGRPGGGRETTCRSRYRSQSP